MEQLIVTIKDGVVELDVKGTKGSRCLELTQAIEKLIGDIDQRFLKNDFYKSLIIKRNPLLRHRFKEQNDL